VVLFNGVVPAPPRRAFPTALAAAGTVPVTYAFGVARGVNLPLGGVEFFFALVLPYVMVTLMAYAGSRAVHRLAAEVGRARELGSYRLVERLGVGGMGEVWRAKHRLLARPAAIKVISPDKMGDIGSERRETILARFEREAQATAAMRCPHTVELYDFGRTDDGAFYYVMELLDGLDGQTLVDTHGPLPAERVAYLLRQVCHSLGEAHDQALIHRDIKPANVFVCRYGREVDWVKVLDFGLVKGSPDPERDVRLTGDGYVGGTPGFMAPEQVLGDHSVDGRTDLYAVGCLAYWLLTGRDVFEGPNPMAVMMQHVQATPEPPSRRAELPLPPELDAVVLACLEKDPDRRPATADDLSARLAAVPLANAWTPERARLWWSRHSPAPRRASGVAVPEGPAVWPAG
jgi:serine/threonine-protein kinase